MKRYRGSRDDRLIHRMRISERQFGSARVFDLHGQLVGRDANTLVTRALRPHLRSPADVIVINLAAVANLDCDGLYTLGKADRTLRRAGGSLRVALPEQGQGSLMFCKAQALFDCFDSVEEALDDVRASMGRGATYRLVALWWQVWADRLGQFLRRRPTA